jgi:hypothetical protein
VFLGATSKITCIWELFCCSRPWVIAMGHQIVVSPDSPFTIDNIPFGVIKTAKESTPRCASAIGDYAIDLPLYAKAGNLDAVKEGIDLTGVFSRVSLALPVLSG